MQKCQKVLLVGAVLSLLVAAFFYVGSKKSQHLHYFKNFDLPHFLRLSTQKVLPVNKNSSYPPQWVVITSIFKPTDAIRVFSQMPGWQLLVVGDRKTPSNWSYKNVIYLGVEEQENLPYETVRHVPWNRYTRKIIGYLYAIQHGAKYIYESDDDNVPNKNLSIFQQTHPYRLVSATKNLTFNPYAHFGQSSTWPRGYPLDRIGMPHPHEYFICQTDLPVIVQSLVNGDPDMDAIYRLTRRHSTIRLDIYFDEKAPMYIHPAGTFSPFNSQNTLFHKKAFWGLLLPVSVTDRATDIYRSYWTQRLMWEIGQRMAFGTPTFYQKRSNHNLLNDFDQEKELYKDVGNFIKALNSWKCTSSTFEMCILEATKVVVDGGFWSQDDYNLVEAWILDLKQLDRSLLDFPLDPKNDGCTENKKHPVVFYPAEQATSMNHNPANGVPFFATNENQTLEKLTAWCGFSAVKFWNDHANDERYLSNIALVVSVYGNLKETVAAFEGFYKLFFTKIVYCTESLASDAFLNKWKVTVINLNKGELSSLACMTIASLMNLNVKGLLHTSDSTWLNINSKWKYKQISTIWLPNINSSMMKTNSQLCGLGNVRCARLTPNNVSQLLQNINNKESLPLKLKVSQRFLTGLKKLDESVKQSKEIVLNVDLVMYFPMKKTKELHLMKELFAKTSWHPMKFLTQLILDLYGETSLRLTAGAIQIKQQQQLENTDYWSILSVEQFLKTNFCQLFK